MNYRYFFQVFLTLLKDIVKQIINTCNHTIPASQVNITYLDENNLYGWAMSKYLLYGGFKSLNRKEIDKFCLNRQ